MAYRVPSHLDRVADSIFLLDEDSTLRELTEAHYLTEANLQQLLADFPQLMSGKQLEEASPRRWMHIKRELDIPDSQDRCERWSNDRFFLDQNGKSYTGEPICEDAGATLTLELQRII